jgi:hypothetical protein
MDNRLPEAPVVMFTNYKRADGFEVSVTLRGEDLRTVSTMLNDAIKGMIASGGTPVSRQKAGGFAPKPVDYVEGRTCPKCQQKLVHATTAKGKKLIKCSTNKWVNGAAIGCDFIEWVNDQPKPEMPERQYSEEY